VCNEKKFVLLNTEEQYNTITKYDKDLYSPSTRTIKFSWFENEYESPIIQVIKKFWFPQDFFISEEVVRYTILFTEVPKI
jgi:hypothetical protein